MRESKIPESLKYVLVLDRRRFGILNFFKHRKTNVLSEGFNNVVKTIKKSACGCHDWEYFRLKKCLLSRICTLQLGQMFWWSLLSWIQRPPPELWTLWATRLSKGWEPARQSPQLKFRAVPTHRLRRRPQDPSEVRQTGRPLV